MQNVAPFRAAQPGTYVLDLKVLHSGGKTDNARITVVVVDGPPLLRETQSASPLKIESLMLDIAIAAAVLGAVGVVCKWRIRRQEKRG